MSKTLTIVGKFDDKGISSSLAKINRTLDKIRSVSARVTKNMAKLDRHLKAANKESAKSLSTYKKLSREVRMTAKASQSLNRELSTSQRLSQNMAKAAKVGRSAFLGSLTGAFAGMSVGGAIKSVGSSLMNDVTSFINVIRGTFQRSTNFLRAQIGEGAQMQSQIISAANTFQTMGSSAKTWDQAMKEASDGLEEMSRLAQALPGETSDYSTIYLQTIDDQIDMFDSLEGVMENIQKEGRNSFTALLSLSAQMQGIRPEMLIMDLQQFKAGSSIRNVQFIQRNPLLQKKLTEAYASMLGMTTEAFEGLSETQSAKKMKTLSVGQKMNALYEALQTSISPEAIDALTYTWEGVTAELKGTFLDPSGGLFGFSRRLKDSQTIIEKLSLALFEFTRPIIKIVEVITGSAMDPLELLGTGLNELRYRAILFGRQFNAGIERIFGTLDSEEIRKALETEGGRMKFAEMIGKSLATLVNGVAKMITDVLSGAGGTEAITDPISKFIDSIKENLDYVAINSAVEKLVAAGSALLVEYESMRAKFIKDAATAAAKSAGVPFSGAIGNVTAAVKAPLGSLRNRNNSKSGPGNIGVQGIVTEALNEIGVKTLFRWNEGNSSVRDLTKAIVSGNEKDFATAQATLSKLNLTEEELNQINEYITNSGIARDYIDSLNRSGLFRGSPPYLRTLTYDHFPELISETQEGNRRISSEITRVNSSIRKMASTNMSMPGGGGSSHVDLEGNEGAANTRKALEAVFKGKGIENAELLIKALGGNIGAESGFDPGIENSIGAFGSAQWLGTRREDLNAFASSRGTTPDDLMTQMEFILHELQGKESYAWQKIQEALATGNLEAVTRAITTYYERPGSHERNDAKRLDIARSFAGGNLSPLMEEMRNKPRNANVVYANDSETILTQEQTRIFAQALSGSGKQPIHIVVNAVDGSGKAIADAVISAIDGHLNQQKMVSIS